MMARNTRILLLIIAVAIAVRLILLVLNVHYNPSFFHQQQTAIYPEGKPYLNNFGFEASNIAYAMVCGGKGFSSPFGGSTGPTGWVAPGIVLVYALAFSVFGCFSFGSIIFMFLLSLMLSAAIVYLVYQVSLLVFQHQPTAYLSSALFAICPHDAVLYFQQSHLDFNLYTFLFLLLLLLFLEYDSFRSFRRLIMLSLAAGLFLLFNPAFALPVIAGYAFLFSRAPCRLHFIRHIGIAVLVISIIISPYIILQKSRLGFWSFIKSNSFFELYLGNINTAGGTLDLEIFQKYHPNRNLFEFDEYNKMGEQRYLDFKFKLLLKNINIRDFLRLTCARFLRFFFIYSPVRSDTHGFGLFFKYVFYALSGFSLVLYLFVRFQYRNQYDMLLYIFILAYALPYMLSGIMWRYSYPIVPAAIVLFARSLYVIYMRWMNRYTSTAVCF